METIPQYSCVVPIYNDAYLANDFCIEFEKVFKTYLNVETIHEAVELIFVDDGSVSINLSKLRDIATHYKFVKVICLSRNFGQHIAVSCGYNHARGQIIGMLNVDMQDPPNQLPLLMDYLNKENLDVVIGLRSESHGSLIEKLTSKYFTLFLNFLTNSSSPLNMATIRVMNRRFLDAYNTLSEKSRFLPGLESWLGFNRGFLTIVHQPRKQGKSSYTFKKRLLMAIEAIISFSDFPLRLGILGGACLVLIGILFTLIIIAQKLFLFEILPGYTSIITAIITIGGLQVLTTGLASIYIGRIFREVQNRPVYVVKEIIKAS